MESYLLNRPPTRPVPPEALLSFESPPVFQFNQKYLHFTSDLRWGDLVQFKRVYSLKIGTTVIVEYKVTSDHAVWASAPCFSFEVHAHWLYFMAEEIYGVPTTVVQLTVLARRKVTCEQGRSVLK